MKRVTFDNTIHFKGHGLATLCGFTDTDLLGNPQPLDETSDPVTCPACAELYCRIKNAPWNEVDEKTMDAAIYAAEGVNHDAASVSE